MKSRTTGGACMRRTAMTTSKSPVVALLLLLASLFVAVVPGCSRQDKSRVEAAAALAPDASPDLIRHLVSSDDSTLATFVRALGLDRLNRGVDAFHRGLACDSPEHYAKSAEILLPLADRLARAMATVYPGSSMVEFTDRVRSLTPERGMEWRRAVTEKDRVFADENLTPKDKIARLEDVAARLTRVGMRDGTVRCQMLIAELYANMGDVEAAERRLRVALPQALELHLYEVACQNLGVLGSMWEGSGETDSMRVCYDRALAIAHRYRLPNQAARITSFQAEHYARAGHLALAHNLLSEAIEICRSYGGDEYELRYLNALMRMHADLGGWDIVGRLLPRARTLAGFADRPSEWVHQILGLDANRIESRYLMACGRADEADRLNRDIDKALASRPYRVVYAQFLSEWAADLVENDRGRRAMEVLERGIVVASEAGRSDETARLTLLRARVLWLDGRPRASLDALEEFRRVAPSAIDPLRAEWVGHDALVVRNRLSLGDTTAAVEALEGGLWRIEHFAAELDPSAHGYFWVGRCDELRRLFHDLSAGDAFLGYGFELHWREMFRALGSNRAAGPSEPNRPARATPSPGRSEKSFFLQSRGCGDRALAAVARRDAVHCVYVARENEVWRWTCTRGGVRREPLGLSRDAIESLVARTWRMMATDPGGAVEVTPGELVRDLGALAQVLLPHEVLAGVPPLASTEPSASPASAPSGRVFYVTADPWLSRLPFETLDLAAGGSYRPLVTAWDVAYVRHVGDARRRGAVGPKLIVANVGLPEVRRGWRATGPELAEARAEAAAAAAGQGSLLLEGPRATKGGILSRWETAPLLYFAGHFMQDPDAPYLTMLPLATSNGDTTLDAASLDVLDVREADLSACRLVVLSGCASGAPYVSRDAAGPSFGDAFLDAGAAAVIQTAWDVRDDQSRSFMSAFTAALQKGGPRDIERALRDARVSHFSGPRGIRHPFVWAAYSLAVSEIETGP